MKSRPQKVAAQLPDILKEGGTLQKTLCSSPGRTQTQAFSVNRLYFYSVSSASWKIKNKQDDLGIWFSEKLKVFLEGP